MKERPAAKPTEYRVVLGLVVAGSVFALALLVRQIWDYLADARQPVLRHDDVISALGSIAMLAFLGIVGFNTVRKAKR